jgi:acyl-CoA synthetase (AMP-forming)/AMP-acid ligase II/thioesterase domain-containing protein
MLFPRVSQLLENAAATYPRRGIHCYPLSELNSSRWMSYEELHMVARVNAGFLNGLDGFSKGMIILLHFEDHLDNIVWLWSTLYAECIPALSTALPQVSEHCKSHISHLKTILEDPLCLTRSSLVGQFPEDNGLRMLPVDSLSRTARTQPISDIDIKGHSEIALLMLTSGSTGNAKAVCLTHHQIATSLRGKSLMLPVENDLSFLNWIRLDHVGSLIEIHMHALFVGADQVQIQSADILRNPILFLEKISEHRVARTFAPNFFLAELSCVLDLENHSSKLDLSCLQYIVSGGEANVIEMCLRLSQSLQKYQAGTDVIVPGFGMTETCAGSIYNTSCPSYDSANHYEFASVGLCVPGIEIRLSGESDLELKGPIVFSRYYNNPTATAEAFTSDGWFKTGDTAMIDNSGKLSLTGRTKEVIAINGLKHSPQEIETAVEEENIDGIIAGCVICLPIRPPGAQTEQPLVLYVPSHEAMDVKATWAVFLAITRKVLLVCGARPAILPLKKEQMQRTSLGKVSRSKLRKALEDGHFRTQEIESNNAITAYQNEIWSAPANEVEEAILHELQLLLGVPAVTINLEAPMIQIGLTSVSLIILKRRIEIRLQIDEIPLITMLNHPSIRELARAIHYTEEPHHYNPVVTLSPNGTKTPLWLFHPGVGEILVFLGLAKFFHDRPVHALRASGFNPGEPFFKDISECVTVYWKAIKQLQPHGPYALAGYSYGSMLAFEVAKLLTKDGDNVDFLGCFNLPPHIKTRMRQLDWVNCLLHLSFFLDVISEEVSEQIQPTMRSLSPTEAVAYIMGVGSHSRVTELSLTSEKLEHWSHLAFGLQNMASNYEPEGTVENMDVFYCNPLAVVASDKAEWLKDHLSKWRDFAATDVRYHDVEGSHYTMLLPNHVRSFQATLQRALASRGL